MLSDRRPRRRRRRRACRTDARASGRSGARPRPARARPLRRGAARRPRRSRPWADVPATSLGLAAGFDKNAVGIDALAALGFGHVEVGTVTGPAPAGQPEPAAVPAARPTARWSTGWASTTTAPRRRRPGSRPPRAGDRAARDPRIARSGVNIGKTKAVPEDDEAAVLDDYAFSARRLAPYADYLVVNVSTPNTPGLRDLQAVDRLRRPARRGTPGAPTTSPAGPVPLLREDRTRPRRRRRRGRRATWPATVGLDGLIATNTTLSRDGPGRPRPQRSRRSGPAGCPGRRCGAASHRGAAAAPRRATATIRSSRSAASRAADDVARAAGAPAPTLLQAYTGFVYGGPLWPRLAPSQLARDARLARSDRA